jgi:hypothetical protein
MQRPKWLNGWGKGQTLFEGSLTIDIPDVKVVEATLNSQTVFLAIGTSQQQETTVSTEENNENIRTRYDPQKNFQWKIFYDSSALPNSMPVDKVKDLLAGTVAAVAGIPSVYNTSTKYIASGSRLSKGNDPLLLDYELAKKIEEAKKQK